MKKTEKAIKALLIENSVPNVERIKNKFNYNTNDDNGNIQVEVIAATKKRNLLLIVCACILLITSVCIVLPYIFNHSASTTNFGINYFDGSQADWQFNSDIICISEGHKVMHFVGFVEEKKLIDLNNPDSVKFIYSNGSDRIIMNVYLDNKLSEEFRYCLNFKKLTLWNSITVRYKTGKDNGIYKSTLFFQDKANKNNYVIRVMNYDNKGIEYYLNKLVPIK